MIRMQTWEQAQVGRKPLITKTFDGFKTIFFESPETTPISPQGFLIEQRPDCVLNTHFHLQHQFQVIALGSGTLGREPVQAFSVHYASPESAYGPITAGADGLWYFTLRAVHDTGAWHLPEFRSKMRTGLKKRHAMGHARTSSAANSPLRTASIETVIAPEEGGLAAWMLRVPPSQSLKPPPDLGGVGRFYIVGRGAMRVGDARLPHLSLLFVSADETDFTIEATDEGVEVVAVQYPADSLNV